MESIHPGAESHERRIGSSTRTPSLPPWIVPDRVRSPSVLKTDHGCALRAPARLALRSAPNRSVSLPALRQHQSTMDGSLKSGA